MTHRCLALFALLAFTNLALPVASVGCSKNDASADSAPKPPQMPAGWKLTDDKELAPKILREEEFRLEGKVKAIRQTTYDANGQKVQLNTIIAANSAETDKIYRLLSNKKVADTLLRKGEILYEFAGSIDALPEIKKARALLDQ